MSPRRRSPSTRRGRRSTCRPSVACGPPGTGNRARGSRPATRPARCRCGTRWDPTRRWTRTTPPWLPPRRRTAGRSPRRAGAAGGAPRTGGTRGRRRRSRGRRWRLPSPSETRMLRWRSFPQALPVADAGPPAHAAPCRAAERAHPTALRGSARGFEDGLAPRNIGNHGTSGSQRVEREPFKLRPVRTTKRYSSIRRHTMSESNKDILRAGYAAFNKQEIRRIMGMFDEDIEWTEPEWVYGPPGGTLHGRDEVLHRVFEPISEDYESLELDPRAYYGEGAVSYTH